MNTDMKKMNDFLDSILKGKSLSDQATILRYCLVNHALCHPWADSEFVDSVLGNIAKAHNANYDAEYPENDNTKK